MCVCVCVCCSSACVYASTAHFLPSKTLTDTPAKLLSDVFIVSDVCINGQTTAAGGFSAKGCIQHGHDGGLVQWMCMPWRCTNLTFKSYSVDLNVRLVGTGEQVTVHTGSVCVILWQGFSTSSQPLKPHV